METRHGNTASPIFPLPPRHLWLKHAEFILLRRARLSGGYGAVPRTHAPDPANTIIVSNGASVSQVNGRIASSSLQILGGGGG